jgi:hypothetical protein
MYKNEKYKKMKIYQAMNKYGIENFYIELICEYECNNIEQLRAEEQRMIRQNNCIINGFNGNVAKIDNIRRDEMKEEKKEYYESNKEEIKDRNKKNANKYHCYHCDFHSHNKYNFNSHLNTITHINNKESNIISQCINKGELTIHNPSTI